MGYWADYENAYWTMTPDYVESVWWALKQIFDKGLLVEDYRVAPYCPRCGTGLSDHEVAQGYEDGRRPVGLRPAAADLRARRPGRPTCWSGRPRRGRWSRNTAVAVKPDVTYVAATDGTETVVVASRPGRSRRSARAGPSVRQLHRRAT